MQSITLPQTTIAEHLRPLDPRQDLFQVADLIELCFAQTMDEDGYEYLRSIRQAARDFQLLPWEPVFENNRFPGQGFVWVEEGKIVGNLSLIPVTKDDQRILLVANVAVKPAYRNKGIGHALTRAAIQKAREKGVKSLWLQVRADNASATHIYEVHGFVERARRSTWLSDPGHPADEMPVGVRVTPRKGRDWQQQFKWLSELYPDEVAWNLPLNIASLQPGLMNNFMHFFNEESNIHWAARVEDQLIGVLTWQASRTASDNLWLATTPQYESLAIQALLPFAQRVLSPQRTLSLNYPANRGDKVLKSINFSNSHTLIWMEKCITEKEISRINRKKENHMTKLLLRWGILAVAVYVALTFVPGIHAEDTSAVAIIIMALVFGLVNALLKPILKLLTCPLIILTLGLFTLVINTILFYVAGWVGSYFGVGYQVEGIIPAFFGSLVITVVNLLLGFIFRDELKD